MLDQQQLNSIFATLVSASSTYRCKPQLSFECISIQVRSDSVQIALLTTLAVLPTDVPI